MTRRQYIERTLRQIYNGQPSHDATITYSLVNLWMNDAIALAAKTNYTDNYKLEGVAFVNNSFYTIFKGLSVTQDEQFLWKITLPQIPVGIGANEGVSTLTFKDASSTQISNPVVWLSENQLSFSGSMRPIPNKILAYPQGSFIYVKSDLLLSSYTAQVTMISGGDSKDLDSTLNVPSDYLPVMNEYIKNQLVFERQMPLDVQNDGVDAIKTT